MRTVIALMILLATSAAEASESRCKKLQLKHHNATKPMIVVNGSLDHGADSDSNTLQIEVVEGLLLSESKVSDDGQIIFLPKSALGDDKAAGDVFQQLLFQSLMRRVAAQEPGACGPASGV